MEKYGFFSSINNDRLYTAEDFTSYFAKFIQNGFFPLPTNAFTVEANGTLDIKVNPGTMWINGHVYELTEQKEIHINAGDGILSRIDRIVVRLDYVNRKIETVVIEGELSSTPVAPALKRDADAYDMCIAELRVDAGVTAIQQSFIVDRRYSVNLCGEITSVIDKHTLKEFCKIEGFTMEGDINTKDLLPSGEANIGSEENRYKKIYTEDIDILNGLPYLPINGGTLKGYLYTQMLIPTITNSYNLGLKDKAFGQAHIKDLFVYGSSPFIKREGDTVEGKIKFKDVETDSLKINGKRVYIQSTPPVGASEGDVWVKC